MCLCLNLEKWDGMSQWLFSNQLWYKTNLVSIINGHRVYQSIWTYTRAEGWNTINHSRKNKKQSSIVSFLAFIKMQTINFPLVMCQEKFKTCAITSLTKEKKIKYPYSKLLKTTSSLGYSSKVHLWNIW